MIDKTKLKLAVVVVAAGIFLTSSAIAMGKVLFTIIGLILMITGIVITRKLSLCPHCGKFIPRLDNIRHPVHFCPNCGQKLEYKD